MMLMDTNKNLHSFTLIELLVVLALVAILSVVVILTLNPAELLKQARDSNRLSDLATINTALNLFSTDVIGGFMGTSTIVYTSLVNTVNPATTTCAGMGLPALPTGWTYNCPTSTQSLRNTDGTGWIPVNFQRISSNSPISQLPIDPQNATSTKYYTYVTGGSWKVMATPESQKYLATAGTDGGSNIGQFEVGNNMSLAPFADGLIGWWKFDEGSGTSTVDSSGYNWSTDFIQRSQTYSWIDGKIGKAINWQPTCTLNCSGTNSRVVVNLSADFSLVPGSMAVWVKPTVANNLYTIIRGGSIGLDGRVWFRGTYSNGFNFTGTFSAGEWAHIIATYDGVTIKLYKDGNLLSSAVKDNTLSTSTTQFVIGARDDSYMDYFNGLIDDVRIYNRALSAAEILSLYNATK